MIIKNNTHYFSEYTKLYNAFPDQDSFSFESSKRMGYFQRLWFEYAYCRKINGSCFYYTLTYNDKSIPKFLGKNCFNYEHIRYITNGRLSKILKRKFHSVLRYFCACESGEGKGTRGLGNNPHYHFIFFVEPELSDSGEPVSSYVKISPQSFKDIMYELWQGAPSDRFVPWQLAKFGHVQEGKYNGEVLSCEAFKYCGKYVVKDIDERNYEDYLRKYFKDTCLKFDICNVVLYEYYKFLRNTDLSVLDKYDFFEYLHLHEYCKWRNNTSVSDRSLERYLTDYHGASGQYVCFTLVNWFHDVFVPNYVEARLSEYKNKYSGKCRMSKSLGEYGLNFIMLVDGCPRVVLNTSKGYEVQYPCLYFIRKLFYDVKICPVTGNPLYYLNDKGIQMKLSSLSAALRSRQNLVNESILYVRENDVYIRTSDSDVQHSYLLDSIVDHTTFVPSYSIPVLDDFMKRSDRQEIIRLYCVYSLIYQHRHCRDFSLVHLTEKCLESDYIQDYEFFLHQNSYFLDYESSTIYNLIYRTVPFSFSSHPAFRPFLKYFNFFDKMLEQVSHTRSVAAKTAFAESSKHQQRLKAYQFNAQAPFGT